MVDPTVYIQLQILKKKQKNRQANKQTHKISHPQLTHFLSLSLSLSLSPSNTHTHTLPPSRASKLRKQHVQGISFKVHHLNRCGLPHSSRPRHDFYPYFPTATTPNFGIAQRRGMAKIGLYLSIYLCSKGRRCQTGWALLLL